MKLNINTFVIIVLCVIGINYSTAQSLSAQDSITFNNAKSDTTLLRQIISTRSGELIAAKAQIRIGIILYNAKNDNKAEQEFLYIYNQFAGHRDAQRAAFYLGKIEYHNEKYEEAQKYFTEFRNSNPKISEASEAEYHLALILYKTNKENLAEEGFLSVYNQYPNQPEAKLSAYYLGSIAFHKDDYDNAKKYFAEYLQAYPTGKLSDFAIYHLLKVKIQSNDTDYVDLAYKFLSEKHDSVKTGNAAIQYDLVNYFTNNNTYDQALFEAKKMVKKYPNYKSTMQVRFQIGEIYQLLNKPQDAIAQYNSIIKIPGINPNYAARAQYELGGVYANQNDYKNARTNFMLVQSLYPQLNKWFITSEYSLAMLAYQKSLNMPDSSNQTEGLQKLLEFVSKYPTNHHTPRALRALADLYINEGKYFDAIETYDKILAFDSTNIPLNQRKENKFNELKSHRSLVKETLFSKARLLRDKLKRYTESLTIYESLLFLSPNNGEARVNKALCLIDMNRKEEAKAILNKIIQDGDAEKNRAQHVLLTIK